MLRTVQKLLALLTRRERFQSLLLILLMLLAGLIEMAGVASVAPLIAVISDPEIIHSNKYLNWAYETSGSDGTMPFLVVLSAGLFVIICLRAALMAISQYAILRYAFGRSFSLGHRLLERYLKRPYQWYINQHGADLTRSVLSEVDDVTKSATVPILLACRSGIIALLLFTLIVVTNPFVAGIAGITVGGLYGVAYFAIRKAIGTYSKGRLAADRQRFSVVQEIFDGLKAIKIAGRESSYLRRFDQGASDLARYLTLANTAQQLPRFVLELIAMGGMIVVILALLATSEGRLTSAFPAMALYGFAALRLLPVVHELYQSIMSIRFSRAKVDVLFNDMMSGDDERELTPPKDRLRIGTGIDIDEVVFQYPNAKTRALNGVSLSIPARASVAFVGSTGSGKSTLLDLLLGLLFPQSGSIKVNGSALSYANAREWQANIGYVPQNIFLTGDTVAANIALGHVEDRIDYEAVERSARLANLHDFIVEQLPEGYRTKIGDKGGHLSGGQRQRIAIARALYHDPDILIFDEATSALDGETERAVIDAVSALSKNKTIIMVAHRLTSVRDCDVIFHLEKGELVASGTYEQIVSQTAAGPSLKHGRQP